jgi:hypothetical protein
MRLSRQVLALAGLFIALSSSAQQKAPAAPKPADKKPAYVTVYRCGNEYSDRNVCGERGPIAPPTSPVGTQPSGDYQARCALFLRNRFEPWYCP